jgi:AbrB family looped-hinge helix DNA binding protein
MDTITTTVTRKYQITIPKKIREKLRVMIGDRLDVKEEGSRIVIEVGRRIENPVEYMWNISKKPRRIDAVKLVKESRNEKMR